MIAEDKFIMSYGYEAAADKPILQKTKDVKCWVYCFNCLKNILYAREMNIFYAYRKVYVVIVSAIFFVLILVEANAGSLYNCFEK